MRISLYLAVVLFMPALLLHTVLAIPTAPTILLTGVLVPRPSPRPRSPAPAPPAPAPARPLTHAAAGRGRAGRGRTRRARGGRGEGVRGEAVEGGVRAYVARPWGLHCWLGLPPARPSHSISAAADKRCLLARSLATAMPCGAVQVGSWVSTGCGISRLSSSWRHVSPCSSKCPGPSPPSVRIPPPSHLVKLLPCMYLPASCAGWLD